MITTLLVFSIIGAICMACLGLAYSNANIFILEYKDRVLKEYALSGIEITKSNILVCVKDAMKKSKNKEEFNDYFLGNGSNHFFNVIKKIDNEDLKNVSIRVLNDNIYEEEGDICFQLVSQASQKRYSKLYRVDVIIKNPYLNADQNCKDSLNNGESDVKETLENTINIEEIKPENNIDGIEEVEELENTRQDLNEKSLVILQNYMEM